MAEAYFRHLTSQNARSSRYETFSAGVFARPGRPGDPRAREVASSIGVSLEQHSARQLSAEDISGADIICTMDYFNEAVCVSRYPASESKILMLGAFGRQPGETLEIVDPVLGNTQTVRACFDRLTRAVDSLWAELVKSEQAEA